MKTTNCAILDSDVLIDASRLVSQETIPTPAEFHALNSLVEAAVLQEHVYAIHSPVLDHIDATLFGSLIDERVLTVLDSFGPLESELRNRGLDIAAQQVLLDRTWDPRGISYSDPTGLTTALEALIEIEENLGLSRVSSLLESWPPTSAFLSFSGQSTGFTRDDFKVVDATFRIIRAFAVTAAELGLELYTGLLTRPFVIGHLNAKRRGAIELFHRMKREFDDVEDTDFPQWKRGEIPILTQMLLGRCRDSGRAFANELLELRRRQSRFRETLTEHSERLTKAITRGERRKLGRELEAAWNALLAREDKNTRLVHQAWDLLKDPLKVYEKLGDKLIERDKLNQAINRAQGLTDLWRELYDAPTIQSNTTLIKEAFGLSVDSRLWLETRDLASRLEVVMQKNDVPTFPHA